MRGKGLQTIILFLMNISQQEQQFIMILYFLHDLVDDERLQIWEYIYLYR